MKVLFLQKLYAVKNEFESVQLLQMRRLDFFQIQQIDLWFLLSKQTVLCTVKRPAIE